MISAFDNRLVVAPAEGKDLWLLHDGVLLYLMASANLVPAKLTLALQNCFDAKILRVDEINKRLFLRPLDLENEFKTLSNRLENCELIAFYAIDTGEEFFLGKDRFLNDELEQGSPLRLSRRVKKLYPPFIVSHLYVKDDNFSKFIEVFCSVRKVLSDIRPISFSKADYSGKEVLKMVESTIVFQHFKRPDKPLMIDSTCLKSAACIVRVKRLKNGHFQAVIAEAIPKKDSCFAHLVDYGRRVKCDLDQLFDWRDQLTNIQILFIVHDETLCFID
ncbi:unnamed protein product [Enterobius vermicularis]|uniref:Tudor domain-containing protein n=1 Tax=Enterobius vermicularis TaxID=51028 RepID=A0A0N4VJS0_ENTVE|nr:unnamed protein product [Enterobius vermicularis]